MTEERHTYITPSISRETFTAIGCRATADDYDLTYHVHEHKYDPFGGVACNDRCTTIQRGVVAHNVTAITLMDAAES